ncbi:hypothetical protein FSARC_13916 [Fusarium sarcochroum]|uniref:Killer toxin Kp4 domain-containing protein n=1 Tax=Fusarium sarcochroum TaxID=1208366 RepID=A0A8H4SXW8_9HYPO|nr:hypothetical protein FSARC_13916 [Fusarium sarcochroum]
MKASVIYAVAGWAASTMAKGINCEGSSSCLDQGGFLNPLADYITDNINGVDPNYWYANGEQIACKAHICAFLQKTEGGAPGSWVRDAVLAIKRHGCSACGSYPFFDNDVDKGELTVNYVKHGCGDGVCIGALNPKK